MNRVCSAAAIVGLVILDAVVFALAFLAYLACRAFRLSDRPDARSFVEWIGA